MPDDFSVNPFDRPIELPRGRHRIEREAVLASQRQRLIDAIAEVSAIKGYNAVTIQDIVAQAGTAKRTFYEHFENKQDCFRQAFDAGVAMLITSIASSLKKGDHPYARVEQGLNATIDTMLEHPDFAKVYFIEAAAAGPDMAERRMEVVDMLAGALIGWSEESRESHPEFKTFTRIHALLVISALQEIITITIHKEGIDGVRSAKRELLFLGRALMDLKIVDDSRERPEGFSLLS